jgi:hypothetical protein
MYVKINGQEIPRNTLVSIFLAPGGTAHASGKAVNENDRNVVTKILVRLNENERIEFELETHDLRRLHGAGFIQNIETSELFEGASRLVKYSFRLQKAPRPL